MIAKNFLGNGRKKGDRLLWLAGLAALGLFAFLAAGSLGPSRSGGTRAAAAKEKAVSTPAEADRADQAAVAGDEPTRSFARKRARAPIAAPEGPAMASVGRTLASLGLIILILFGGATIGARYLKKLRMKPSGEKVLELVDVIALGPKRQVFVVSAYGRKIVVGATNETMNVLSEFDQDEIAAASPRAAAPAFAARLDRDLGKLDREPQLLGMEVEA